VSNKVLVANVIQIFSLIAVSAYGSTTVYALLALC
jgi:hypothetical protein